MAKYPYKLAKMQVKKAIQDSDRPTYGAIARILDVHHSTLKLFLSQPENKNLLDMLNNRRVKTTVAAETLIEDAIIDGDTKLALEWLKFEEKRMNGDKLKIEGDLGLTINIVDKDKEE